MDLSVENIINKKFEAIFDKLGLDKKFAAVKNSDRPDLSDFQCNGALALAKSERKNPREIAQKIAAELEQDNDIEKISVDGPGFINITLKNEFIARNMDEVAADERFGCAKVSKPQNIVIDSGGPNVAKLMHIGHLRPAVIGESIRRIEKFVGNKVISDVHFGDWGTPMGMIISEIENLHPDWPYFDDAKTDGFPSEHPYDVNEVTELYKKASAHCKEDEAAREKARIITAKFQDGHPGYRALWRHLRDVSVDAVKEIYGELDVNFDLWLGESDAHETCKEIMKIAKDKGILEKDEGAEIIRLEEANKPKPPVILEKSDGGFTYAATDIATIKMRCDDLKADEIIYVTDLRQSLHFEQVFEASKMLGICPDTKLVHIGFGTVNGKDGKPFKTRDGGVMNIQYAIARINSIIRKAQESNIKESKIVISNEEERNLALKIAQLNATVMRAHNDKEPSIIADYAYTLAQSFSSFYNASSIVNAETPDLAGSRLKLARLVRDILKLQLYLLGIASPEAMLKSQEAAA